MDAGVRFLKKEEETVREEDFRAGNGNRGYFWYTPWPKIFRKYPLELLRKSAILFRKSRKNGKISLNLTRFGLNYANLGLI